MAEPLAPEDETAAATLPKKLGSYLLLQRLGRGGMGTVYLARQQLGEFERLCVVKLVRRRHLGDPLLRQRFLDEARTTLLLTHRNICRVLDVGTADGLIYIAMEHVAGRDLRTILKKCAQRSLNVPGRDSPMPPALAAMILGEVLEALDSAHRLVDPQSGKPLEIVHRDVSPHNVMVSFEGEVKLIDFGVARSATQLAQTDPGLVVGKLAYMSPEQSLSEPKIDGRSDVFAAGILGYETFACDRFYEKSTVDEIGEMLDEGTYKAPRMNEIPPGARALIEKALTFDVEKRPRAGELRAALRAWTVEEKHVAGAAELRAFLAELFPGEEDADRKRFRELFSKSSTSQPGARVRDDDEPETVSEGSLRAHSFAEGRGSPGFEAPAEATVQERKRGSRSDSGSAGVSVPASSSSKRVEHSVVPTNTGARRARRAPLIAAGFASIAIAGVAAGLLVARPPSSASPSSPPVAVKPPPAPVVAPVHSAPAPPPAPDAKPALPEPAPAAPVKHHVAHNEPKVEPKPVEEAKPVDVVKPAAVESKPTLPPRPRLLLDRVRYLKAQCAPLGCTADVQSRFTKIASMTADQTESFKSDIDKCLDACGAPK